MPRKNLSTRVGLDELAAADAFLHVVRAGSFTAAAKVRGKSTSSLSRTIADLERQLGAQLIARTTRRLHVTEAGQVYARHAEVLLAASRAGRDAIAELTGGVPRGHLRVTMPASVGERVLGPQVAELRRRYPELQLELDLSDRPVPLVEGGYDLAIRVGRLPDSPLRAQLLGKLPIRLVASPRYLARRGTPRRPDELPGHDCILLGPLAGPHDWPFFRRGVKKRLSIDGGVHTTSPSFAAQLAVSGLGLLRVVDWVIRDELRRGDLVEVMPEWACDDPAIGGVPVYVMYAQSAGAAPPLKSRVFVELVKETVVREGLATPRVLR
jgi:DNA-binding transcriptional LysR family regulator